MLTPDFGPPPNFGVGFELSTELGMALHFVVSITPKYGSALKDFAGAPKRKDFSVLMMLKFGPVAPMRKDFGIVTDFPMRKDLVTQL